MGGGGGGSDTADYKLQFQSPNESFSSWGAGGGGNSGKILFLPFVCTGGMYAM